MKASDKIYVTPVGTWDTEHITDLQDNVYISKYTLLEWIKNTRKAINECTATDERKVAALSVIEALDKKLNSL